MRALWRNLRARSSPEHAYEPGDWVEVDTRWNGWFYLSDSRHTYRGRVVRSCWSTNYGRIWVIQSHPYAGPLVETWATPRSLHPYIPTTQDEIDWILAEIAQ